MSLSRSLIRWSISFYGSGMSLFGHMECITRRQDQGWQFEGSRRDAKNAEGIHSCFQLEIAARISPRSLRLCVQQAFAFSVFSVPPCELHWSSTLFNRSTEPSTY